MKFSIYLNRHAFVIGISIQYWVIPVEFVIGISIQYWVIPVEFVIVFLKHSAESTVFGEN